MLLTFGRRAASFLHRRAPLLQSPAVRGAFLPGPPPPLLLLPRSPAPLRADFASSSSEGQRSSGESGFSVGDELRARVLSFGPLGASVTVESDDGGMEEGALLPLEGLITQYEIGLFREARRGADVIVGDTLPAYVNHVREDGKVDVGLRPPASDRIGLAKAAVLEALSSEADADGSAALPVGDKSAPEVIRGWFPGMSKKQFKDALGGLRREGIVRPSPHRVDLVPEAERAAAAAEATGDAAGAAGAAGAAERGAATSKASKRAGGAAGANGKAAAKTAPASARIREAPVAEGVTAVLVTGLPYRATEGELVDCLEERGAARVGGK